jgi:hypothetical protein
MYGYAGLALGDLLSGSLSQFLGSRRKSVGIFLGITAAMVAVYGTIGAATPAYFYAVCFLLGLGNGYWAVFVTIAAEQFGTNLRATVAISVPNFVRGSVVPITLAFRELAPRIGLIPSAMTVGAATLAVAGLSLALLRESFGHDLDYLELDSEGSSA